MSFFNIAVLITCHNRVQSTLECLTHLYNQEGINKTFSFRVFLVDDGSTDGTSSKVSKNFPDVIIIKGDGTLYWNRGMYTAWKSALQSNIKFDAYLWLNDDTFLLKDGFKIMLNAAVETKFESIICGSIHSPVDSSILTYGGCRIINKVSYPTYPNGNLQIADLINGNCVLVPHDVYIQIGNLDYRFRHAIGDNEYSLRAKLKNIISYSTGYFVGACSNKNSLPKWCLSHVNLKDRLKNLYSPLGSAEPIIFFKYNLKYFGLLKAIKSFLTTHIRVLVPQLWKRKIT
jgi:GT2 family glycosyltransferase